MAYILIFLIKVQLVNTDNYSKKVFKITKNNVQVPDFLRNNSPALESIFFKGF